MNAQSNAAQDTADGLAALTRWSTGLTWSDVEPEIQQRVANIFADDLAAIIAARDEPEMAAMIEQLARSSGAAEATVFNGGTHRFDRYTAALANGSAADWCELDSGYRRAVCHAGLYCLPALLAEGEATGASLSEMLRGLLIGYECVARVARAFIFAELKLHPHATLAAVGAAAAVSALRGHEAEMMAASISSAATMVVPGPFNHAVEGALIRNIWPGTGAAAGLRACDWIEIGITGRAEGLHDVFATGLGAQARPAELTDGLGESWAVGDGYHKLHACCQYSHGAVEATLDVMAALPEGTGPEDVRAIHIDTHPYGELLDKQHPPTTLAAKFSLQHVLATTARHGHAGATAFHADTLDDPMISGLRERVTIGSFAPLPDWPNDRPARVRWELADGTSVEQECMSARGGPDRPFKPAEIHAKITGIVAPAYPELSETLTRLLALNADTLSKSWRELVAL